MVGEGVIEAETVAAAPACNVPVREQAAALGARLPPMARVEMHRSPEISQLFIPEPSRMAQLLAGALGLLGLAGGRRARD